MIIAQISDTHITAKLSESAEGLNRAENLRQCIADIKQQKVDVVIHTGDTVHNGLAEEYEHLHEILSDLDVPFFLIPGNRDRHGLLRSVFKNLSYLPLVDEFLHYAVEDFPIRLVALDSVDIGERKGVFCAKRLAWLENTLFQEPEKATILFIHHPPFDISDHYLDGYRHPKDREDLRNLVGRHSQVKGLLCGHVHSFHCEPWAGTIATTMPSVALDLRKEIRPPIDTLPSYLLHFSNGEGQLFTHYRVSSH